MKNNFYFVKSLDEDFHTKILKGKNRVNFQSIQDIVYKKVIHPNTKSFGQKSRLSTSILNQSYLKTYRAQGIIFQTNTSPSYILPFDLIVLTDVQKIIARYYLIKENIYFYYNHKLIPGFEKFIFKDFNKLLKRLPDHKIVWEEVNAFRLQAGHKKLPISKHRLIEYNRPLSYPPPMI